jgi:glycyl-tRNA synthetase beta chain
VDALGAEDGPGLTRSILDYVRERIYQGATDEGFRYDLVRAVLAAGFDDLNDLRARLEAMREVSGRPFWPALVELVERAANITKGADASAVPDEGLFEQDEERALAAAIAEHGPAVEALADSGDYAAAAERFAEALGGPVHAFFEKVFVNVEDEVVRANRLALLGAVNRLFGERVADLSGVEKDPAA